MMMRAQRAKTGSDIDRDGGETRWVDGDGNSRGEDQTVRSINSKKGMGTPMRAHPRAQGTGRFEGEIHPNSFKSLFRTDTIEGAIWTDTVEGVA